MKLFLICAMLAAVCGGAVAQVRCEGVCDKINDNRMYDPLLDGSGSDTPTYSRSVTGRILSLDGARAYIMIEKPDRSQLKFVLGVGVRLRADKDTALAGRTDLSLHDYKPDQLVKIVYRVEDNKVLELRLKRLKS